MGSIFIKEKTYTNKNSVKVTTYKLNPELEDKIKLYIPAINIKTGEITKRRITGYSKHENLEMYKISSIDNEFEPFWASFDHSLICYDKELDQIRKVSPKEILINKARYFLIKKVNENDKKYISCLRVNIELDKDINYAYDLTVEEDYTFCTHDGIFVQDTVGAYFINTEDAVQELFEKKMFAAYHIKNLQNDSYIHVYRQEALHALNELTSVEIDNTKEPLIINTLSDYTFKFEDFYNIDRPVYVKEKDKTYPLGLIIVNKLLFDDKLLLEVPINKKNVELINDLLYNYYLSKYPNSDELDVNIKYLDKLQEVLIHLSDYMTYVNPITISENDYVVYDDIVEKGNKLPEEPYIGKVLFDKLVDETIEKMKEDNSDLYKIYKSGARASKDQIAQIVTMRGYIADDKNRVLNKPIKANLMQGLTPDELFLSSYGARKGIIDKHSQTPVSGYLSRTMIMNTSYVTLDENFDDCGTDRYLIVELKNNPKIASTLLNRYYLNPKTNQIEKITVNNLQEILKYDYIKIRSPLYCKHDKFRVCKKCSGDYKYKNIGLLSGAFIAERMTQLILRTFHTSGAANIDIPEELYKYVDFDDFIDVNRIKPEKVDIYRQLVQKINQENDRYSIRITDDGYIVTDGIVINKDIITAVNNIKSLLTKTIKNITKVDPPLYPDVVYKLFINEYLKHGHILSLYIETILSVLYAVRQEDETYKPIRYVDNIDWDAVDKLSIKQAGKTYGKIVYFIYEPNRKSLFSLVNEKDTKLDIYDIYYRLINPDY